jgi:hypothetical protein
VILVEAAAELFLLSNQQAPEQVRIDLSRQLAGMGAARSPAAGEDAPAMQVEQLPRLASMLEAPAHPR